MKKVTKIIMALLLGVSISLAAAGTIKTFAANSTNSAISNIQGNSTSENEKKNSVLLKNANYDSSQGDVKRGGGCCGDCSLCASRCVR